MKKFSLLVLIVLFLVSLIACKSETVTLHCDGENCTNSVEIKISKDGTPDESWIIFCETCANEQLDD